VEELGPEVLVRGCEGGGMWWEVCDGEEVRGVVKWVKIWSFILSCLR